MGSNETKPVEPSPPPKTPQEMMKEFTRQVKRLQREFTGEIRKLENNDKKIRADIEKSIKKKEPKETVRILAQNLIRNQNMVKKYQRLDAQMANVLFTIQVQKSNDAMVKCITGMNDIMKQNNQMMDPKNMSKVMMEFQKQAEMQGIMMENMEDAMDLGNDESTDEEADKLIFSIENQLSGNQQQVNNNNIVMDQGNNFDAQLNQLKNL